MPTITTSQLDYWLHQIQSYLTECHNNFHRKRINDLILRHDQAQSQRGKERRSGFIYNGLIWRTLVKPHEWFEHLLALDESLHPEMDQILADEHIAQRDFHRIRQISLLAFRECASSQDIRDVLPECMLPAFPKENLRSLPRTREPGYTLAENPIMFSQWQTVENLMNYHCAMRLILA